MVRHLPVIVFSCMVACATPALAQYGDNQEMYNRMDRLERDVMTMQRQVARGGQPMVAGAGGEIGDNGAAAQLDVQLSQIEDELRSLRGQMEETQFQSRKNAEMQAKFEHDVDFRLTALEGAVHPIAANPAVTEVKPGEESPGTPVDNSVNAPLQAPESFATPRELYNYAFHLVNKTRYEDAARYFTVFTQKYPKDPLIGNAYYWLGETYYIRQDYVKAADNFRAGFEALPGGSKAADNLLKLSMSLAQMKNTHDACVVLDQLRSKFKDRSPAVVQKAETERTRIGCP